MSKELNEILKELITDEIRDSVSKKSQDMVEKYHKKAKSIIRNERRFLKGFRKRRNDIWGNPLDLLDVFLQISLEAGGDFNEEMRPAAAKEKDYVFEVLCRLHSRACRISGETLLLMRNGYASGALARWRALHEIAVIGFFVRKNGNEVAEKYLLYEIAESYKAMENYNQHCKELGCEPYADEELNKAKEACNSACQKFGKDFTEPYGWAAGHVETKNRILTIADIEKAVGLDYLRPYYKMASYDIHATTKGITFNIGIAGGWSNKIILAGPTNAGLADPGQLTAISIFQITCTFLSYKPMFRYLVILQSMSLLLEEIKIAFMESHNILENRIKANPEPVIGKSIKFLEKCE